MDKMHPLFFTELSKQIKNQQFIILTISLLVFINTYTVLVFINLQTKRSMMTDKKEPVYRFGEKIKKIRERQGKTLKVLAAETGVSTSLLSQIENNRVSPSMDTLLTISDHLEIDPEYLFRDYRKKRKVKIVHKDERNHLQLPGVVYEQLSPPNDPDEDIAIEALELQLEPGGQKGNDEFGHIGREMGIILEGRCKLLYGGDSFELSAGDSLSFSSKVPHTLINTGDIPLKAVWIISPPRMFSNE